MKIVLDASALLAVLLDEAGAEIVIPVMRGSMISAVNISECLSRAVERGFAATVLIDLLKEFEIDVMPFGLPQAAAAAELRPLTKSVGASLGDRAFLSLGIDYRAVAYTADRRLSELDIGVDIRLVR